MNTTGRSLRMMKPLIFTNSINTLAAIYAFYMLFTEPNLFVLTIAMVYGLLSITNWTVVYSDYILSKSVNLNQFRKDIIRHHNQSLKKVKNKGK